MGNLNSRELTRQFAHVPYIIVQLYLGIYALLLLVPPIEFAVFDDKWKSSDHTLYWGLFEIYSLQWQRLFQGTTALDIGVFLFLIWPLGALLGEAGYRLGKAIHYHDDFNLDQGTPAHSEAHFRFRCHLLRNSAEHRMWDWQNFQFNFFYFSEILMALLFLALLMAIARPMLTVMHMGTLKGFWLYILVVLDVAVFVFLLLMRTARKQKLEDFRQAHQAAKAIFAANGNAETEPPVLGPGDNQ